MEELLCVESAGVDDCRAGGVRADRRPVLGIAVVPKVLNVEDVSPRLGVFKFYVVVRECLGRVGANVLIFLSLLVQPAKGKERSRVAPIFRIGALSSCGLLRDSKGDLILALADLPNIDLEESGREMFESSL